MRVGLPRRRCAPTDCSGRRLCFFSRSEKSRSNWGVTPTTSGRDAYGAHLIDLGGFPSVEAAARIFCNGVLKADYGPVTLTNGNYATQEMNDFWKIAEVAMDPSGDCQVFPFGDGTNVIVRANNAMNQR